MPGYEVPKFKDDIDSDRYVCSRCELLLKEPIKLRCEHRLCRPCAEDLLAQNAPAQCPRDDCKVTLQKDEHGAPYPRDESVEKEINNLVVVCPFSEAGCDWEGCWHEYQQHIDNCDVIINLPSTRRSDVRPFYCTLSFSPTSSLNGSIKCDKCHVSVSLSELNEHRETCLLQSEGQQCPLSTLGCPNESYMDSYELEQHLQVSEYDHLSMIVNCIQLLDRETALDPVSQAPHHEVDENMNTEKLTEEHTQDMLPLSQIGNEVKNLVSGEMIKLQNELMSSMEEELQTKDEEIASLNSTVAKLERQIRSKNVELKDRDFRLSLIENNSHDGTMLWKIPQFSQRKADTVNGKYMSIFSLPFYSGRYGYKMCLRLYIMGDGIGKGTHLSLFFVVMRGEIDNILQWPFTHKVTFKLFNQAGGGDIIHTFQPDPMSTSFRKPKSDMNIASGCPRFVSHTELERGGFVVEDTIFIKCTIDTSTIRHP